MLITRGSNQGLKR